MLFYALTFQFKSQNFLKIYLFSFSYFEICQYTYIIYLKIFSKKGLLIF